MDSYGRKFAFDDPYSTEDTICFIQALDTTGEILPSNKLPLKNGALQQISITLSQTSKALLADASFLITSYDLMLGGTDLITPCSLLPLTL